MKRIILIMSLLAAFGIAGNAREYHVSVNGNDSYTGSESSPFLTINRAAQAAYPGDVITVHAGVYREWVNPPRGGDSDDKRIIYRAAPGEKVEIKGSERIVNWERLQGGVWKIVLPNTFFGDYNPYVDLIYGDWFDSRGREHHTGEVFLNNKSLYEMVSLDKVMEPVAIPNIIDPEGSTYTWYCQTDGEHTTIWANFHKFDPNKELVEISVRRTCFYPEKQSVNYLTIQGFHISQAATQWPAPTAEQIGMVATHWNKGWLIENNVISNSKCAGITLGKERSTGHNTLQHEKSFDAPSVNYVETIFKTLRLPVAWIRENIGSHIVRNNEIFACEQSGICGSMCCAFSIVENNYVHHIWTKRQFAGMEIAGIKFHGAIDTQIRNNRIHHAGRGMWLDWMAQGTRVSNNLFYDNDVQDLWVEVNHGPFLVDNNIFGSPFNIYDMSQGGAYAHNLLAGAIHVSKAGRSTPYHVPHQTDVAGMFPFLAGDNRYYNNLFMPAFNEEIRKYGTVMYSIAEFPSFFGGNVYYKHAQPFETEKALLLAPDFDPAFKVDDKGHEVYISFSMTGTGALQTERVTTQRLGKAKLPKQAYEQPDGTPIVIDRDYFGNARSERPSPGPFEQIKDGEMRWKVW